MTTSHRDPAARRDDDPQDEVLNITVRDYDHDESRRLVTALYAEQILRYGYADPAEADPSAYMPPGGIFVVGRLEGVGVACGGFRAYDSSRSVVEIKKMYTVPELRGRGFGHAIIRELVRRARDSGAGRAILETGVRNTAALALYADVGFTPIDRYVDGRDPEINRAFAKDLFDS